MQRNSEQEKASLSFELSLKNFHTFGNFNLRLAGANYSVSFALEELQTVFSHVRHKSALRLSNLFLERSVKQ